VADTVVADDEIRALGGSLDAYGTVFDTVLANYQAIIEGIGKEAVTSGAFAQNVQLLSFAVALMKGKVCDVSSRISEELRYYLENIDEADFDLYS
jgi:hypothetical protein